MLDWFQALMAKETRFFDLFERHAAPARDAGQCAECRRRLGKTISLAKESNQLYIL
jgi:hypothetical protein